MNHKIQVSPYKKQQQVNIHGIGIKMLGPCSNIAFCITAVADPETLERGAKKDEI